MATSRAPPAPGRTAKLQIRLIAFNTSIPAHAKTHSLRTYLTKHHPRNGAQGQTTRQAVTLRPALQTRRAVGKTIDARERNAVLVTSCPRRTAEGQMGFETTTVPHRLVVAGGQTVEGEARTAGKDWGGRKTPTGTKS